MLEGENAAHNADFLPIFRLEGYQDAMRGTDWEVNKIFTKEEKF